MNHTLDAGEGSAPPDTAPDWLDNAPLMQAWREVVASDPAPFTIPGHKRRADRLHPDLGRLLDPDVPLYGGLDTVKLTGGVLRDAERLAADLWGADVCRFSTGGSTHANQVLCLTVGQPGDVVLVARNAHRSVLSGLVLAGLRPVWIEVRTDPRTGAPLGLDPATVRRVRSLPIPRPWPCSVRSPAIRARSRTSRPSRPRPTTRGSRSWWTRRGEPTWASRPDTPNTPSRPALTPWSPARTRCCPPSARPRSSWREPSGSIPIVWSGPSRRRTPPARPAQSWRASTHRGRSWAALRVAVPSKR